MSHFNIDANQWDTQDKIDRAKELASKMKEKLSFTEEIDILDFGCGTGLLGLEFLDSAKSLLGIDNSSGMLEVFDKKVVARDEVSSLEINLETETLNQKFDLIISSMTFHHLKNPSYVLNMFSNMLNSGGKIMIVDLETEDGTFHPDNIGMGVHHHGFSQEELISWGKTANLKTDLNTIYTISKNQKSYNLFLAIYE